MSMDFDPATGEILEDTSPGPAPEEDWLPEPPPDLDEEPPAPEDDTSPAAENGGPASEDAGEALPVRVATGYDFEVSAADAAAMMTERLGKKTTPATFRRLVIDGRAPAMLDPEADSPRWSQIVLDGWLDELEEAAAAEPAAADLEAAPDGTDFYLTAPEAAALYTETVGRRLTVAGFRRMVMDAEAPAPALQVGGTAKWSQAALDRWLQESLLTPAPEVPAGEEDQEEGKPVHRDVYDFYARTFSAYYELHDGAPNPKNRAEPKMAWCTRWWLHRGVVGRVTAAWFAWEVAHAQGGTAISAWILEHADRHFDRIMAEDGPLRRCKGEHSDALDVYPTEPAPGALRTPIEDQGENDD